MSQKEVQVLNGDALRKQLPQTVIGQRIICREATIEGPLQAELNEDFWQQRSTYFQNTFETSAEDYQEKTIDELRKVQQIRRDANVYLWFEHDLFCQCNLWMIAQLLQERKFTGKAYLVLPLIKSEESLWQGFGNHSTEDIQEAWNRKFLISPREWRLMVACWQNYTQGHLELLKYHYEQLTPLLPYWQQVFDAHTARLESPSRPERRLLEISSALDTDEFGPIFQEFSRTEGIYGYGDLQVKHLWQALKPYKTDMEQPFKNYYESAENVDSYIDRAKGFDGAALIEHLNTLLPDGATVLELGMGPGVDLDLLAKHYQVTGSDLSNEFLNRYKDIHPEADLLQLDAVHLYTDRQFDCIYSNKVLHHLNLTELEKSLLHQTLRLNKGGMVCHTFWKGSDEDEMEGMFFKYHEKEALVDIFEMNYELIHCEEYTEMEENDSILVIARAI